METKYSCFIFHIFVRSGEVTPLQVAKNIIAALEDAEKGSPPLRAIVQWDRKEIIKVCGDVCQWKGCLSVGKGSHPG